METALMPKDTGEPYKVLLAEDKEVAQELARNVLEYLGCGVDIVADGSEAIDRARVYDYDLILMDCEMPMIDGYRATEEIRKTGRQKDIPIVALTAKAFKDEKERCLEAGMNDYMSKPIREDNVCEIINKWCAGYVKYEDQW